MKKFIQTNRLLLILGIALVLTPLLQPIQKVSAAEFEFATGYYIGKGTATTISGLGFEPKAIFIKGGHTSTPVLKHADMPANTTHFTAGFGTNTNTQVTFNADGFSVGGTFASVGSDGALYYWMALGESDCSATGTLCVSSYLGDGTGVRDINVGFQPASVIVQPSNLSMNFRNASFPALWTSYFTAGANITNGSLIQSFNANGFRVGPSNNTNGVIYYYVAFSNASGKVLEGTYTGNGIDNRDIITLVARPDFLMIKNLTISRIVNFRTNKMFGDLTGTFGASNSPTVNIIQNFLANGFQIGTDTSVNTLNNNYYYFGLTGENDLTQASGTFDMNIGSYIGNGGTLDIPNIGFAPDMVISKGNSWTTYNLRTSGLAYGFYKGISSSNITVAGLTLGNNNFNVGNNAVVNSNGVNHFWQAFGNGFNPYTYTGSEDFAMGAYLGNGAAQAVREINDIPFNPDFVFIKNVNNSHLPGWQTSLDNYGVTNFFAATASVAAGYILDLIPNGFSIGTDNNVNGGGSIFSYYAFKLGLNFQFGTYIGNAGLNRPIIIDTNFQPDLLWVSPVNATAGVFKASNIAGLTTPTFANTSLMSGGINSLGYNNFNIGNNAAVNSNGVKYYWFAFNSKKYTQANYRFFENADSTLIGAPIENQNTTITTANVGETFRLRMIIDVNNGNLLPSGLPLKLQVARRGGAGTCAAPQFAYTDVSSTSSIAFYNNPSTMDKAQLTTSANDPSTANTLTTQQYIESNNFNNVFSSINKGQSGIFDFSLIDYAEVSSATYCFRIVYADNDRVLNTYNHYPSVNIVEEEGAAPIATTLTFSISHNNLGFGKINHETTRYATNNGQGSLTDNQDALTITASTNATNGYLVSVNGTTMTCSNCSNLVEIEAVGGVAAAPITGTEQFGMRANTNLGNASITAPFNTANWAFEPSVFQEIAAGDGDEVESELGIRFMTNAEELTPGGKYQADLQFIITANY